MHIRTILLSAAAAGLVVLAGCGLADDTTSLGDLASPSAPATSAGPSPSAAGDCAAYVNADDWCENGIGDYDCEGGSGNGPNYAPEGVEVVEPGVDPFGLDRDNDGEGCEAQTSAQSPPPAEPDTDPRFDTCGEAIAAGYGPYYRGSDPEYDWYRDADGDGVVCE